MSRLPKRNVDPHDMTEQMLKAPFIPNTTTAKSVFRCIFWLFYILRYANILSVKNVIILKSKPLNMSRVNKRTALLFVCSSEKKFSHVGTGLPGLNQD